MTMPMTQILDRLGEQARHDGAFAAALESLVRTDVTDPFAAPPTEVLRAARRASDVRREAHWADLAASSLTTAEVVQLIPSIGDRKAVDRRRSRGNLLGVKAGTRVLHPAWQFDREARTTRKRLGDLLVALRLVRPDPFAAAMLMAAPNPNLDGQSIGEAFMAGRVDVAIAAIDMAADQS